MSTEQNKTLARRWLEEVMNRKNLAAVDELFATNLVDHAVLPWLAPDIESLKQLSSAYFNAFPDLQVTIEDTIAEGDKVMTRLTWRGTHRGELMCMPPTGKQVAFSGMEGYRIADGKIVEIWAYSDNLGMFQQLGVIRRWERPASDLCTLLHLVDKELCGELLPSSLKGKISMRNVELKVHCENEERFQALEI